MKLVKDGILMNVIDSSTIKMYKSHGWVEAKEKPIKAEKPKELDDTITKKELQTKLDELHIPYKPNENKNALIKKIKNAEPANDFDDGLLKG
jgi:hypothetical protein